MTALAVCTLCGAGLCPLHVQVEKQELHEFAGMGKTSHDQPARRLVCTTCAKAEHSP
ncbi:DUF2180 family protein [Streptomyces sp. NPDC004647]|uniref:DUF2180 family protein n=1 Tax=Streptomyces sp. NPDC004647 TaxID=3154671 RepID=UPI0033B8F41C